MRVAVFASGSPLSVAVIDTVAEEARLVAVVAPRSPGSLWRRIVQRHRGAAGKAARRHRARRLEWPAAAALRTLQPDLLVIASFPHILPETTLAAASVGTLNVHMSLLPRHRGPDPVFWTYWHDDAQAGVSVHWVNGLIDAGDVVSQQAVPLARGRPSRELYFDLAQRGASLLAGSLRALTTGRAARVAQHEPSATYESRADIARAVLPYAEWPAERVWHVLSGLGDQRSGLVEAPGGVRLAHGRATSFRIDASSRAGRLEASAESYRLHCRDGVVDVARRPVRAR